MRAKVRHIGVSNFDVGQMERIGEISPVETLQPPYNLISRGIEEEILPHCEDNDIDVIVYSPMKSGLLTGKMTPDRVQNLPSDDWRRDAPEFNEPGLSRNLELVKSTAKRSAPSTTSLPLRSPSPGLYATRP